MAIREIPRAFSYSCDIPGCACEHTQENAGGHYHNSCPPGWMRMKTFCSSEARAGTDREYLLCPLHTGALAAFFVRLGEASRSLAHQRQKDPTLQQG